MTLAENLEVRQPARHRRRVRLAGAPHGPRQAAGLPGEPAEGQLHRPPRPGRQRLRRRDADQPELQGDPEIAKWLRNRDFRHAHRRWGSTATSSTRRSGSASARPARPVPGRRLDRTAPGPSGARSGPPSTSKQANELLDKIGLTKKDSEGYRLRTDGKGRLRIEMVTIGGTFIPYPADRRDDLPAAQEDRHPDRRASSRSATLVENRRATATRLQTVLWCERRLGDAVLATRTTRVPVATRRPWGRASRSGTPSAATQGDEAERPADGQGARAVHEAAAGLDDAERIEHRQGDLEDRDRGDLHASARSGCSPAVHGRPHRQEQRRQRRRPARSMASTAGPRQLAPGDDVLQVRKAEARARVLRGSGARARLLSPQRSTPASERQMLILSAPSRRHGGVHDHRHLDAVVRRSSSCRRATTSTPTSPRCRRRAARSPQRGGRRTCASQYGLDQPIYVQYVKWMGLDRCSGNFGMAMEWRPPGHRGHRRPPVR